MQKLKLESVANEVGATACQVIIAWLRQSEPAVLPIIAASQTAQLSENINALDISLSRDQMARLNAAGNPQIEQAWIR